MGNGGALANLNVADLTQMLSGPYCRGKDTEAVVACIGYTDGEIAAWRNAGVVSAGMREKPQTQ